MRVCRGRSYRQTAYGDFGPAPLIGPVDDLLAESLALRQL
jgi:hypothetical protein